VVLIVALESRMYGRDSAGRDESDSVPGVATSPGRFRQH